jgi:hypothetical protein
MSVSRWKVTTEDRKSLYVEDKQFQLTYRKGMLVVPSNNAPGVFVFDTKDSAERHIAAGGLYKIEAKILRVLPIGRAIKLKGFRPTAFDNHTIYRFWRNLPDTIKASKHSYLLYIHLGIESSVESLDGTLIYPAVKVMD